MGPGDVPVNRTDGAPSSGSQWSTDVADITHVEGWGAAKLRNRETGQVRRRQELPKDGDQRLVVWVAGTAGAKKLIG